MVPDKHVAMTVAPPRPASEFDLSSAGPGWTAARCPPLFSRSTVSLSSSRLRFAADQFARLSQAPFVAISVPDLRHRANLRLLKVVFRVASAGRG
jgi:hypothetical protein